MCYCTPSRRTPWCSNCRPSNVVPAGGVRDPRGALDQLFVARDIDFRQYNAGRDYARCYLSPDPACTAIFDSCNQALRRFSIFAPEVLKACATGHVMPVLERDKKLLREALSVLAMHLDQVDIGLGERAAGPAGASTSG